MLSLHLNRSGRPVLVYICGYTYIREHFTTLCLIFYYSLRTSCFIIMEFMIALITILAGAASALVVRKK